MIESWLEKLSPTQFFTLMGALLTTAAVGAVLVVSLMIITNLNVLEWME